VVKHLNRIGVLAATALLAVCGGLVAGCGGQSASGDDAAASSQASGHSATAATDTLKSAIPPRSGFVSQDDPNAVYTESDIPERGNFLKLDFSGMDPETLNKVIHRLRTEHTPCTGETCAGLTFEEALITELQCDITVRGAKNVIREEKMKSGEFHRLEEN